MAKEKEGKERISLVYYSFLKEVAKVREFGAKKYGNPEDWRGVVPGDYVDAAMRHLHKSTFELCDKESSLLHLSHAATNIMFLIEKLYTEQATIINGEEQ